MEVTRSGNRTLVMSAYRVWVWGVLLAMGCVQVAWSSPQNGFGLSGGMALHRSRITFVDGTTGLYTSGGVSLAGDAQFVINDRWSLNPYLLLSLEKAHQGDATISNGAAGLELRRWDGPLFLGLRIGEYVELRAMESTVSTRYGPGLGASFGQETEEGHIWSVQLDLIRFFIISPPNAVGLRLHFGWRWGDT